jgi:hypothetical protein
VTSRDGRTLAGVALFTLACALMVGTGGARVASQSVVPPDATALEGTPQVRVDTTPDAATRRQLGSADAEANRLRIQVKDGAFYWSSRDNSRLALTTAGEFTYLSSTIPGRYVRIRRVNDRLTYVEHVDTAFGSITYWGELKVVLGK